MLYAEEPSGRPVLQEIDSRKCQEKGTVIAQYTGRITTDLIAGYLRIDYPILAA